MKLAGVFFAAAAMAAGPGAQAGDLSATAPEFSGVCSAFGAGFQSIPGTDTCVRVGGSVRFESGHTGGGDLGGVGREENELTSGVRGTAVMDTRTQTDLGLVRTYIELNATVGPDPQ